MVNPWKARAPKHRGGGAARYAHGNGVALRASARRLSVIATAVCAASAMMLSYVVAFTAKGDSTLTGGAWDSKITDAGAISPPQTLSLGDNVTTTNKPDTGVATYVGGNMYVGEKIGSDSATVQSNLNDKTGITGSYAAEAEGLTLVDGRLAMRQLKNSWGGQGFRFGVVGFGSQFRPAETYDNGKLASVLAVRGRDKSGIATLMGDKDINKNIDVASWGTGQTNNYGGGWIGYTASDQRQFQYVATMPTDTSIANEWDHPNDSNYKSLVAIYGTSRRWAITGWPTLHNEGQDPSRSFKINGVDYADFGAKTLQSQSSELAGLEPNGSTSTPGAAPSATGLTRYKYDYYKHEVYNTQSVDSYKFEFLGGVNEKLITLTGDGESALQVFKVKASDLSTDGDKYSGVDFWFRNIPDSASVVVNVINDDGSKTNTNTVDFHNGWRMWWGGKRSDITDPYADPDATEIGGYYSYNESGSDNEPAMYAKRAQQVLWNFPYTTQLTIRGGQGSGKQTVKYGFNTDNEKKKLAGKKVTKPMATTGDDPAAAWIGSIYVPQGGFQSHVSTNGRVYVGGDFEMDNPMEVHYKDNPTAVHYSDGSPFINFEGGNSASVIDMDQERHNLPWNAYYTQDSSAIGWGKVDNSDGNTPLSGASWSVYGSLEDAKSDKAKAIISVTDNGSNDWSNKEGEVVVKGLKPNANYFIKETKEPEGYRLNTNIYTVQTKQTGDANVNFLTSVVYDKDGSPVTTSDGQMMHSFAGRTAYAIGDKKKGGSVSWTKYAEGDSSKTGLAGSSWTLTKTDASTPTSWTVNDNTTAATGITLTQGDTTVSGGSVQVEAYKTITLKASVAPAEASQQVTWKSSNTNFAVVTDGVVTGVAAGASTITACSVTNSGICSSVTVTVNAVNVNSLTVTSDGSTVAKASGDADKTVSAEADVKMFVNKTQLFQATVDPNTVATSWSALDPDIVSVSDSGLVTAKKTGSTTVVATAGNKSVRLHVTVINVDSSKMVVYFHHTESESGWTGDVYLKYQKNDGTWPAAGNYVKMKQASCSGDYVYAIIDRATSGKQFLFSNNNTNDNTANWYKAIGNTNFSFTGGSAITVGVGKATDGAPSGTSCPTEVTSDLVDSQATMAAAKTSGTVINAADKTLSTGTGMSHASDAVVRTTTDSVKPSLRLAADTDTLEDTGSGVGKFTVKDLDDGTYTLKEATAPVGYTLNATSYSFTVKDGKVNWTGDAPSLVNADGVLQVPDTPTVVTWYKVDGSNVNDLSHSGKLAGSQWKITDASGDVFCLADNNAQIDGSRCIGDTTTYRDSDTQSGVISVKGLPVGTYKLKETVAPTLYQLADTEYTFTVTADASTAVKIGGSFTDVKGSGNKILNNGMTGTVTWKKTDEKGELGGSKWQLILYPDYAPTTKSYTKTVIDWSDSSSTTNSNCEETDTWNCDVDSKAGTITLKNLPWGKYELKEKKAPAGHQLSTNTYTFTIVRASQSKPMDRTLLNIDLGSIENETSITSLPLTGGEWTPRNVVIAGLIVLGVAAVSYGIARRRRRR